MTDTTNSATIRWERLELWSGVAASAYGLVATLVRIYAPLQPVEVLNYGPDHVEYRPLSWFLGVGEGTSTGALVLVAVLIALCIGSGAACLHVVRRSRVARMVLWSSTVAALVIMTFSWSLPSGGLGSLQPVVGLLWLSVGLALLASAAAFLSA